MRAELRRQNPPTALRSEFDGEQSKSAVGRKAAQKAAQYAEPGKGGTERHGEKADEQTTAKVGRQRASVRQAL